MKYTEYKAMVKAALPQLPLDILTGTAKMSPPEIVTLVATQLFIQGDVDSPLAKETRHQLLYKAERGIMDFPTGD